MNSSQNHRSLRAGTAFMEAIAHDPPAQRTLKTVLERLRAIAAAVQGLHVSDQQVLATFGQELRALNQSVKQLHGEWRKSISVPLRREQEKVVAELRDELKTSDNRTVAEFAAYGIDLPNTDLEAWEDLARLVEKDPGPLTLHEIQQWAIAWVRREQLRYRIAHGATPIQADSNIRPKELRSPLEGGIRADEHDPRIVWCVGKRVYLGQETQISRLFWLLATPIGKACSIDEVQRAIDGVETSRKMHDFPLAAQRLRKAISRLRNALREGGVDEHLLIVRGGDAQTSEFTMLLRHDP